MGKQHQGHSGLDEIRALEQKARSLKTDTEAFVSSAKKLSDEGVKEAKSLIGLARDNWKAVLGAAAALGIGGAILSKRSASSSKLKLAASGTKKTKAPARKGASSKKSKTTKTKSN